MTDLKAPVTINGQRLWNSLMEMAEIGATKKGGCNRQALTDLDKQARDLFVEWTVEAGCTIRIDQMGNMFARRAGANHESPAVISGSHIDTQPTGGKFDGVYGVLAALEVIRSLNDQEITTNAPIEAVVWTNEEGARFAPAMIGSGVWCGEFSLDYGHSRSDREGKTIAEELERIGYLGGSACEPHDVKALFEAHIEQGPILENENLQIGIVGGVQGINWFDLILRGEPVHAGPTPMDQRCDPFRALHQILDRLYKMVEEFAPWSRLTFGDINADPGSRNTIPDSVTVAVDIRHPEQGKLDEIERRFREICNEVCATQSIRFEINEVWKSPAVTFNEACVSVVRAAAVDLQLSNKEMFSGAGHDAVYASRVAPSAMIFVPCEKGISHNEAENAKSEDLEAGCNVLINAMLALANAD